jgi:isoquinoline 1-oxidoreductase
MINAGGGPSGVDSPYKIPQSRSQSVGGDSPLRTGSYRALASTGSNFARESAMDELALLAGRDPLEFRLAHLENPRLRAVLTEAAKRFDWAGRSKLRQEKKNENTGIGLAIGTEKNSVVAACVEIVIDKSGDKPVIKVRKVTQVFECGPVTNPSNLINQIQGAIIMGLGPALREAIEYKDGSITTNSFFKYRVPRFADVPELDVSFLNPQDATPAGAGETPIIAIAPAIANAVANATSQRLRTMPMRLA